VEFLADWNQHFVVLRMNTMSLQSVVQESATAISARVRSYTLIIVAILASTLSGCTSILSPISGVPSNRLPATFFATPKNNLIPIDISRLRQEPPREYLLDKGDTLGIYIEGVLGDINELPPVQFPPEGSNLPPAIGYPVPVGEDGNLRLPLVKPIPVKGLTIAQAADTIRRVYTIDNRILQPGKDRIIVTLMKERVYRVIVMRQDGIDLGSLTSPGAASLATASSLSMLASRGQIVSLPAYQNDVLHALAQTGGLPGVNAKNEVKILRSSLLDAQRRDEFVQQFYREHGDQGPCLCAPPLPEDPAIIRIPLRLPPGNVPTFRPEDILLEEGDIIFVESREREVFYTGGLLGGGEYPLPRDYDLDALTALAIVGKGVGSSSASAGVAGGGSSGMNLAASIGGPSPGELFILRHTPCGGQVVIAVDMNRAIRDPRSRPLIQAGDILILRYKPSEELVNFGLGAGFFILVREAFRGN